MGRRRDSKILLKNTRSYHPERSEGSAVCVEPHEKADSLLVQQIFLAQSDKLLPPLLPSFRNPPRILSRCQRLKCRLIHQQLRHAIQLEVVGIKLVKCGGQIDPQFRTLESVAIQDQNVYPVAKLPSEITRRRRKRNRYKPHTRDPAPVQVSRQFPALHPGRAQHFKRSICPAAYGNIRALDQTDSGIERCLRQTPHIRRRIHPCETSRIKPIPPLPSLHRHNFEVRTKMPLPVEHFR